MRKEKERGAIVVEATISLSMFIFAVFTILSIVNICYIQAKMSIALNTAAKEISQYTYLYYKFNLDKAEADLNEQAKESRDLADDTVGGIGELLSTFSEGEEDLNEGDFEGLMANIYAGTKTVDSLVDEYAEAIGDDPKAFIAGMGKLAANEIKEEAKTLLAQVMAKSLMRKNLKAFDGDTPENFLRRYHVVDGMKGLDFNYSSLMAYGTSNQIVLVVTYDVEVIKLLDIDFKFTFRQCAKTTAWGRGISQIEPEDSTPAEGTPDSTWDLGPAQRGKLIVSKEKANYPYEAAHSGYDAYDNSGGKNEFVTILSINTHDTTYQTSDAIRAKLNKAYTDMDSTVEYLSDPFEVKDKSNVKQEVVSKPDTRTYRVVLVVPEDASDEVVNKAKTDFLNSHKESGETIVVEIKKAYGSPTPPKVSESDEE